MRSFCKAEFIAPLMEVARRYAVRPQVATLAAAYAVLLSIRHGEALPLPALKEVLRKEPHLPGYVRDFLIVNLAEHWGEYQQIAGSFDEDSLIDFFSNEATLMLMEERRDCSTHPVIDQLCIGLLHIEKGNTIADLNCGIGKLVRKAWFASWDVAGSDNGLSVSGYSQDADLAAISHVICDVTGVGAKIVAQGAFTSIAERYDRIVMIPPFGLEMRRLNMPMVQRLLGERLKGFPELRLSSADWVFAARAASLLAMGGRAVVAVPMHALNGMQGQAYREFLVRNRLIESVISIPGGFLNGTAIGFALVVLREGSREIKFVNGEKYRVDAGCHTLDVRRLLKDYDALNDYDVVTTRPIDKVYAQECDLSPDVYLGEDLVYNHAKPLGELVRAIRRGAKLPVETWRAVEGGEGASVRRVAFRNLGEGLIDEALPGLTGVPDGGEEAVLEAGDLLISRVGFPFKIAVVEPRSEKLVADENVWIVRTGGDVTLAYYLRAYLESARGMKWLSRLSTGASLRTISARNIAKIPVPDADEGTREAIARELEKTTILVRENRKRLDDALMAMKNVFDTFNKDGGL